MRRRSAIGDVLGRARSRLVGDVVVTRDALVVRGGTLLAAFVVTGGPAIAGDRASRVLGVFAVACLVLGVLLPGGVVAGFALLLVAAEAATTVTALHGPGAFLAATAAGIGLLVVNQGLGAVVAVPPAASLSRAVAREEARFGAGVALCSCAVAAVIAAVAHHGPSLSVMGAVGVVVVVVLGVAPFAAARTAREAFGAAVRNGRARRR